MAVVELEVEDKEEGWCECKNSPCPLAETHFMKIKLPTKRLTFSISILPNRKS